MMLVLVGILIGALLPVLCALVDEWLQHRRRRRLAVRYLRRHADERISDR